MEMKIDYSEIAPVTDVASSQEDWEPPRKVFFGKKDSRGKMEKEPVYIHQEFPRMIYKQEPDRVVANIVNNEQEKQARLADGYVLTLGELGIITAPSYEQILEMKAKQAAAEADEPSAPKLGRPRKAA